MEMSQKQENLLSISLQVTKEERQKSPDLDAGYLDDGTLVEIIVRYAGSIVYLQDKYPDTIVNELLGNYGIITARKEYIEDIIGEEVIEYAEKPKLMYFELATGKAASCINPLQTNIANGGDLFGEGVIVAVIDTGINPYLSDFKRQDNTTRIVNILDQARGVELSQMQINEYIAGIPDYNIAGFDTVGHGTDVARIACGNEGVASRADILVVKLGVSDAGQYSFPRTTQLMSAVDYCVRKGIAYDKPVAINISFGNNYGDHTGGSLLEGYLDAVIGIGKNVICVGSGNEGGSSIHASGVLNNDDEVVVELAVSEFETSLDIQIWKDYVDDFEVEIITPSGANLGRINRYNEVNRSNAQDTEILTYYGEPSPYNIGQEIYINLIPVNTYIQAGIWRLRLIPVSIVYGRYDIWLPATGAINEGTGFTRPDEDITFTVPSTARNVITVGAYDATRGIYATFSGVGYVVNEGAQITVKPEIVAPGVNIRVDDNRIVTGTSFATPFVTGGAALLMEWGIVDGNDAFLYGEKVKAYLIRGAKPLLGESRPSDRGGWGLLCVANSLLINS